MIGPEVELIPAWLYFVGPMVTLMMGGLATTVVMHYRKVQTGMLVPKETVELMKQQYKDQLAAVQENHKIQLVSLEKVVEGTRAEAAATLASKQRDVDDWRGAYHIGAENWKLSEDRMDEVLETNRMVYRVISAALPPANPAQIMPTPPGDSHG